MMEEQKIIDYLEKKFDCSECGGITFYPGARKEFKDILKQYAKQQIKNYQLKKLKRGVKHNVARLKCVLMHSLGIVTN